MRHHPAFLLLTGLGSLGALAYNGLDTISDAKTYTDHAWAWYVFGADFILLAIILARAALQIHTNRNFEARLEAAIAARLAIARQVGVLEGISAERGRRVDMLIKLINVMRERTIILRDCDEDHEARLTRIEDKFRLAHDQAVARIALRSSTFSDTLDDELEHLLRLSREGKL